MTIFLYYIEGLRLCLTPNTHKEAVSLWYKRKCTEPNRIFSSQIDSRLATITSISWGTTRKYTRVTSVYSMCKCFTLDNIDLFVPLFNKIYDKGRIPDKWLESIFVPLPQHTHSRKCSDFKLISLMSNVLKILLKLLYDKLFRKCEAKIGHDQFGFWTIRNKRGSF